MSFSSLQWVSGDFFDKSLFFRGSFAPRDSKLFALSEKDGIKLLVDFPQRLRITYFARLLKWSAKEIKGNRLTTL